MLRGLFSAAAMIGPLKAEIAARARHAVTVAVAAVVCLLFVIVGLFCLAAAAIAFLAPMLGLAVAAAIVGGGSILIGLIVVLVGSAGGGRPRHRRQPADVAGDAAKELKRQVSASPVTWLLGAALVGVILGRRL
jgi:hypothetical protein